jgi:hypothetical protein
MEDRVAINQQGTFKQAHELVALSDHIAVNYGEPCGKVVLKVTGNDTTTLVITVPNSTPVRYLNSE